jgi:hypothetical protein
MLRAPPPRHPLQKCTVVQWDMGALFRAQTTAPTSQGLRRLVLYIRLLRQVVCRRHRN